MDLEALYGSLSSPAKAPAPNWGYQRSLMSPAIQGISAYDETADLEFLTKKLNQLMRQYGGPQLSPMEIEDAIKMYNMRGKP